MDSGSQHENPDEVSAGAPKNWSAEHSFDDETLRAILAGSVDWLWESDRNHRLIWLSESVEAVTGLSREELIGRSRNEIFAVFEKDDASYESHLADIEARRPFAHLICEMQNSKPDCRWIKLSGIPICDESGEFKGYRGAGRNVTEAFAFRDQLYRARNTLRYHTELTDYTIDALDAGVIVLDTANTIKLCNRKMRMLYPQLENVLQPGICLEDLLSAAYEKGVFALFSSRNSADEVPDREEWVCRQLANRASWAGETSARLEDGRWIQANNKLLDNGTLIGIRIDVTEIKKREAEALTAKTDAESAKERLQTAIEALNDGFVIWDSEDRLVAFNEAFRKQFSNASYMTIGRTFTELLLDFAHSGDVADAVGREEEWVAAIAESRREEIGKEIVFKTHDDRWIMRRDELTANGDRVGIRTNITEIKQREYEAEQARRQLAIVLESLPAGVMIFDRDDRFVFANKRLREDYPEVARVPENFSLRDLVKIVYENGRFENTGDPELDALYHSDRTRWEEAFYRKEYFQSYYEHDRQETDGRWVKAINLRTDDGLFVGVRINITEHKRREAALEAAEQKAVLADRTKSEFLANMSHEIRTPMNGVLGMAELLAKTELDAKQKTFTDIIVKSGNALLNIINDILDFSKIDAGHLMLDAQPFALADAIGDVVTLISTRAKEKDLELAVRIQPDLPEAVSGDIGRVRQIIMNLVGNAVKFTDVGHVYIDVSGKVDGGNANLHFEVSDTGIGIPADKINSVFEKFAQADSSSTRRHEGTGLGLAITSRLIEMMGGKIGVESREGKGSKFWFDISMPVAEAARVSKTTPEAISGSRILVIDDNELNRSILLEQLQSWSFDCCAARSGKEGLMVLEKAAEIGLSIQCVVLDYQMPEMNGEDIVRAIRNMESYKDLPIILLSSVEQSLSYSAQRELNINAHLLKPVRAMHLLDMLATVIRPAKAETSKPQAADEIPAQPEQHAPEIGETGETRAIAGGEANFLQDASQGQEQLGPDALDILVAEDNEVNQMVFSQILADTGYSFEITENGRIAFEKWQDRKPRMIFMDVSMPEMNGFQATKKIRAMEGENGLDRTPVVGVTAYALKGDRERCLEAGMDDYMSKPVSPHALEQKIREWIRDEDTASRVTG